MKSHRSRQTGFTLLTVVVILFLIGFFTMLFLKIAPIYMNNMKVTSSLEAIKKTTDIQRMDKSEVFKLLKKRFDVNYVDRVKDNDIKITKHGEYLKVKVNYEVVETIVGNLAVLVTFDEVIEVGRP